MTAQERGDRRRDAEPRGASAGRSPSRTRSSSPRAPARLLGNLFEYCRTSAASRPEGLRRAGAGMGGAAAERGGEPVRGAAHGDDAAGRPRRGDRSAAATLGAGKAWRRLRGADLGRARYRQVAHRPDYRGTARRRATHAATLFLLAASPGQRALSEHRPARTGGRLPARGYGRAAARQAGGSPGPRDQRSQRGRSSAGGPAVDPDRRPLSAAQSHPAEAQGEDASRPSWRSSRDWRRVSRC